MNVTVRFESHMFLYWSQIGCRFLQQKLEEGGEEVAKLIFEQAR